MSHETAAEIGEHLIDQLRDPVDDLPRQLASARDWAVKLEQEAAALSERLTQLEGIYFHVEGDGRFYGQCLLCGADWPCIGYAAEVSA